MDDVYCYTQTGNRRQYYKKSDGDNYLIPKNEVIAQRGTSSARLVRARAGSVIGSPKLCYRLKNRVNAKYYRLLVVGEPANYTDIMLLLVGKVVMSTMRIDTYYAYNKIEKCIHSVAQETRIDKDKVSEMLFGESREQYINDVTKILLNRSNLRQIPDLSNFTNLQQLYLSGNQITNISGLESFINLEELYLQSNRISKIQGLDRLTNLKHLSLASNKITEISGLGKLAGLEKLHLDLNYIKEIKGLDGLSNLQELYLDSNDITKIQGLDNLTNLQLLSLVGDPITKITGLKNLTNLHDVEFGDLSKVVARSDDDEVRYLLNQIPKLIIDLRLNDTQQQLKYIKYAMESPNFQIQYLAPVQRKFAYVYGLDIPADKKEFFLPKIPGYHCSNDETVLGEETIDPGVFIIAYGNIDNYYCIDIDEINDNNGFFRDSDGVFSFNIPGGTINETFVSIHPIDKLLSILNYANTMADYSIIANISSDDFVQWKDNITKAIRWINEHKDTLNSLALYEINIIEQFKTLKDKKTLKKLLIEIFKMGMYMRRWGGKKALYPMKFTDTEGGWAGKKVLLSNGKKITLNKGYEEGILIRPAKVQDEVVPLQMAKISSIMDEFSQEGKIFVDDLRGYQLNNAVEERVVLDSLDKTLNDYFRQVQGRADAACIQLMQTKFILTGYRYLEMFYQYIIPSFELKNFDFMHY